MVNKWVVGVALLAAWSAGVAQVGTTVKEGAKATGEKAQELGDRTKAAVASEPHKSVDKTKARVHKAKAHHHAKEAGQAAREIPK